MPSLIHKTILAVALAAWLPSIAFALTPAQVYERVKDSVVVVKVGDQQGRLVSSGSGVMLPSGDIITNYHVVKGGVRWAVGRGKHVVPANLKWGDCDKDLCLLTAPGLVAEPAHLGKADRLKVGDPVYAVGAPQGLELSLSEGIISQLRGGGPHPIIQTTVAISPGSSGGGLFNAKGELVGITTFYLKGGQSLNFALPVEWIGEVAKGKTPGRFVLEEPVAPKTAEKPKEGWDDRGRALGRARDWQGLLDHSRRWTQAEPGNYLAWSALGRAYGGLGRYGEAIEPFQNALRLKPNYAKSWLNLGASYGSLGRHQEASEAFREALRHKPDLPEAWGGLAIAYAASGNRSEALNALKELRRYDPQKADELFNFIMKR
jgi:Flp pilus assembly protein TadD